MEDKELQELEEFTLEDIIREFSDHPVESAAVELPEEEPAEEPEEEVKPEEAEDLKAWAKTVVEKVQD
jgi:hypothetical protein